MLLQEQNHSRTVHDAAAPHCKPNVSFVMPVYNGLELTRVCLRTLAQTVDLSPHEVILVNDGSTDDSRAFLDALRAPYRVLHHDVRLGYAAAVNRAAAHARYGLLCLLNNDLILSPGWLEPMLRAFDLFPSVGFVGNVQRSTRTGRYDHLGVVFDNDGVPWHYGKHFFFDPHEGYTSWRAVTAACCLIRRDLFLEMHGFDESYVNGSEDIDLCLRLWQRGYSHYVAHDSVIFHHVSTSEGRLTFVEQNQQRLAATWGETIQRSLTPRDRRLFAYHYILRNLTQPWRYDGPRLWRAALCLTTLGRYAHAATPAQR